MGRDGGWDAEEQALSCLDLPLTAASVGKEKGQSQSGGGSVTGQEAAEGYGEGRIQAP